MLSDEAQALAAHSVDSWPLAVKRGLAGVRAELASAVVFPGSTAEVARVLAWASGAGVKVVPWGAGSSVTGAPLPTRDALVVDLRGLDRIVDIDPYGGRARVEAGVLGGVLEHALAAQGMTTWFSPQSLSRSTIGGWVATRATGQFSSRWGGIEELVLELTVVLADGRVVTVGSAPRGAVGPDLKSLFIGSEGSLGVVTEVLLRIHRLSAPAGVSAYALPSVAGGVEVLRQVMREGLRPLLLRLYDEDEARHLAVSQPPPGPVLFAAFGGPPGVAEAEQAATAEILAAAGAVDLTAAPAEAWFETRYDFSPVERLLASRGGYAETIEIASGWGDILTTYSAMKAALGGLADEVLCHFSHTYSDGVSLYLILLGRASDDREAVSRLEAIWSTAMRTALDCGAVISHHHGVGQARAPFLAEQLGAAAAVLGELKRALDPAGVLHPASLRLDGAPR